VSADEEFSMEFGHGHGGALVCIAVYGSPTNPLTPESLRLLAEVLEDPAAMKQASDGLA
jgi:hypothetical protein